MEEAADRVEVWRGRRRLKSAQATSMAEADHITALLPELRLRIMSLLPLKSAIRTGALSTAWRGLWRRRFQPPSSLHLRVSRRDDTPEQVLASLERRGVGQLDSFSIAFFRDGELKAGDLDDFLSYAAACDAEDLLVNFVDYHFDFLWQRVDEYELWHESFFCFRLWKASPLLARLCLRGISIDLNHGAALPFSALEVIHLHSVWLWEGSVRDLVTACPRLHTLDLRYCHGDGGRCSMGAHLRSLTVVHCKVNNLIADTASGLRSFRYSGQVIEPSTIPATALLGDLCLCFDSSVLCVKRRSKWLEALPSFSGLTVLTICSCSLPIAAASAERQRRQCRSHHSGWHHDCLETESVNNVSGQVVIFHLQNLRELHLLMSRVDDDCLFGIYEFFRTCRCPQLERLFVQLPDRSGNEYPLEGEVDGPVFYRECAKPLRINALVDAPFEELSEEVALKEKVLEEEPIEEEAFVGEPSHEEPREEVPVEEAAEEELDLQLTLFPKILDWLPQAELENLVLVKMVNFRGDQEEMKFVSSLLRKASTLNKLLLIAPRMARLELHHLRTQLSSLKKSSTDAQIMLTRSDDTGIYPVHLKISKTLY